jgi:hypothetical protein
MLVNGSAKSSFRGMTNAFQQLSMSQPAVSRSAGLKIEGEWVFAAWASQSLNTVEASF